MFDISLIRPYHYLRQDAPMKGHIVGESSSMDDALLCHKIIPQSRLQIRLTPSGF